MTAPARGQRGRAVALAGLTGLVLGGCAGGPGASHPLDLIGCWYFQRDARAEELRLPWGVRLSEAPIEGWPALQQLEGVRVASTLTGEGDLDHPFGFWRPLGADSITIGYPGGGGLTLRLEVDSVSLTGTAHPVGDAMSLSGADRPITPVTLERASCPEADPDRDR